MNQYDVVILTDCKLPGGTAASVAEEITAQARFGYRTALVHVPSRLAMRPIPFNPRITRVLDAGFADLVTDPTTTVNASLSVVRHPTIFEQPTDDIPVIASDQRLVVVNQSPISLDATTRYYDPAQIQDVIEDALGPDVAWAPIGPLVREGFERDTSGVPLTPTDWLNVIDVESWTVDRSRRPKGPRPIIGRHGRDHVDKWPASADDILAAYPIDGSVEVRILGGASRVAGHLGRVPEAWHVFPYGVMSPRTFLAGLDFFVYFHAPQLIEAFGRTILEALASGVPALVDTHFRNLFGDACVYTTPTTAMQEAHRLFNDPEAYEDRSEVGLTTARERFSYETHRSRLAELIGNPRTGTPSRPRPISQPTEKSAGPRKRVLCMSSNGAGVGHLMRLMAMARRFGDDVEPIFFTLSQAIDVVRAQGFPVEYLSSVAYLRIERTQWHPILRNRLNELIARYEPSTVVFEGTWPFDGLIDARNDNPATTFVWSRRGMWREDVVNHRLDTAPFFDLIIEPGELAASHDHGPTSQVRDGAVQVGPVTYLQRDELLDREEARRELELDPDALVALVHLGAGNINETGTITAEVVSRLRAAGAEVVVTRSAIARNGPSADGVRYLTVYPLARYLRAFDMAVAAPGYNTFHEFVLAGLPTAFVPNLNTLTDDQAGRARWAEEHGVGVHVCSEAADELDRAIEKLLDPGARNSMRQLAAALDAPDGAAEGAKLISDILVRERVTPTRGDDADGRTAPDGSKDTQLLPPRLRLRAKVLGWYQDPSVRARVKRIFDRLPLTAQARIRRRLKGWDRDVQRGRDRHSGRSQRPLLPLHPGRLLTERETEAAVRIGFVLTATDRDELTRSVEALARLQTIQRSFAPLLFTTVAALDIPRRWDFQVEYLVPPTQLAELQPDADWTDHARDRITTARRLFGLQRIVVLDPDVSDDAAKWSSLRALV